jgi:hypothetical protein
MNKYADMYIDAWRCHGIIRNVAVPAAGTIVKYNSAPEGVATV